MKNIDKIRGMSAEELGAFLGKAINQCSLCHYQDIPECSGNCKKGITKWLNAKCEEPMPKIKIGDVLYSYIDESRALFVVMSNIYASNLHGIIVRWRELDDIWKIERMNDEKEMLEVIWRADNGN